MYKNEKFERKLSQWRLLILIQRENSDESCKDVLKMKSCKMFYQISLFFSSGLSSNRTDFQGESYKKAGKTEADLKAQYFLQVFCTSLNGNTYGT